MGNFFNEQVDGLISRYLDGRITDDELVELRSWLEESEEHRKHFVEMAAVKSASDVLGNPEFSEKQRRMLERINNRIDIHTSSSKAGRRLFHISWGVAAAFIVAAGLLFVLERYPSDGGKVVEQVSPQVLSYINVSSEICPVRLEDGTEVLLGPDTRLDYRVSEYGDQRERLADIQGKAYFDVKKDTARPFVVNSGDLLVRVLGTRFIVESHPDSTDTKIFLEEGSIRLETPDKVNLVQLTENQRAVHHKENGELDVESSEVSPYVLNHFKRISFRRISMSELIGELERMFKVRLYADHADGDTVYEINFYRTNTLDEVLDIVHALTGVRIRQRV